MTTTHWQSLCCDCGHVNIRAARILRYDRVLFCRGCGSYAFQVVVGQNPAEDWREQANYGRYDPIADLRQRWPGWRFECKHLDDCGESFSLSEKLIKLDVDIFNRDWRLALTHAIGHLYLGHIERGGRELFGDECDAADDVAEILLGR
jgi:hypothetical protein